MKFFNLGKIKELTFTLDAYIKSLGDATIVVVSLLVVVLIASTVDRTVRKNRGENAEKQNAEEENLGERETLYQEMVFCPLLFECPMWGEVHSPYLVYCPLLGSCPVWNP